MHSYRFAPPSRQKRPQLGKMSPKIETQKEPTTENQLVSSFYGAPGGNRTRTDLAVQGIFLPLWLSPPFTFVVWTIPSPWSESVFTL